MSDPIPSPVLAGGSRRRRVRLLALVGLIALGAGGTGALAATVAHRDDTTGSGTSGPSIYIPVAGQQSSGASGGYEAMAPAQGGAAAMPIPGRVADSAAGSSIAYPYPYGVCVGSTPAQVSGQVVTATGTSTLGAGSVTTSYQLYAWVTAQSNSAADQAVTQVQRKLGAVVDALVSAGVSRSSIHASSVSVYANGGKIGGIPSPTGPPQVSTVVNASASLTAELPGAASISRAVSAAAAAGADNVNASTQAAVGTPKTEVVAAGLAQATDQAHQLAAAAAKAAGVTLGGVRSVSVQQPTVCGYGADGPQLVVGVTVAYAIG